MDLEAITSGQELTLETVDADMELAQDTRPRAYLGASSIGKACVRDLFYGFRWYSNVTFPASTIRKFEDGFASEDIMAARLKRVVDLETHDPVSGKQFGFSAIDGHFKGHCDGLLPHGTLESTKPAVWEHKCSGEKVFQKLHKLKVEHGEKNAMREWNPVYAAQADIYMLHFNMEAHYLTVNSAGSRDHISIRTDFDAERSNFYMNRAERIIASDKPPPRIGRDKTDFRCRFCDHVGVCWDGEPGQVNCRTCRHSYAAADAAWVCQKHTKVLDRSAQEDGCQDHEGISDV